ncbi:hypothetical protein [Catalinimonas niigatensis]|nr:hypothetical protein [Catalinimonas niigatensis]WPP52752.1 hypothetical protein PZB72_10215 [Catalinimonas niigatensis]
MRKTSLIELRRIVAELNSIKVDYEINLKSAVKAIEWIQALEKSTASL